MIGDLGFTFGTAHSFLNQQSEKDYSRFGPTCPVCPNKRVHLSSGARWVCPAKMREKMPLNAHRKIQMHLWQFGLLAPNCASRDHVFLQQVQVPQSTNAPQTNAPLVSTWQDFSIFDITFIIEMAHPTPQFLLSKISEQAMRAWSRKMIKPRLLGKRIVFVLYWLWRWHYGGIQSLDCK
jgi:hypothetical protein